MVAVQFLLVFLGRFIAEILGGESPPTFQLIVHLENHLSSADVFVSDYGYECMYGSNLVNLPKYWTYEWTKNKKLPHRNGDEITRVTLGSNEQSCTHQIVEWSHRYRKQWFVLTAKKGIHAHLHYKLEYASWFWWYDNMKPGNSRRTCQITASSKSVVYDHAKIESEVLSCGDEMLHGKKSIVVKVVVKHLPTPSSLPPKLQQHHPRVQVRVIVKNERTEDISVQGAYEKCMGVEHGTGLSAENPLIISPGVTLEVGMWTTCDPSLMYFYINEKTGGEENMWAIAYIDVQYFMSSEYEDRQCRVTAGKIPEANGDSLHWDATVDYCVQSKGEKDRSDIYRITVKR